MAELKNARREKFAQGLAAGLSQRNAYREAFPNSQKWKDRTVDSRASELYLTSEILGRLKELAAQSTSKAVMTAKERKEWLSALVYNKEADTKDKLKAIDLLNRMEGEYIEKVQVKGDVNNPMAGLTTEELKKLVNDG